MIRLINGNVERIVSDEAKAQKWKSAGFKPVSDNTGEPSSPEKKALEEMTVEELKTLAKEKGIAGCGALRKDDLLAILKGENHDGTGKTENPDEGE